MRRYVEWVSCIVRSQKGAVIPLIAIAMVSLIGMTALVVDVGFIYLNQMQLANSADAAVLAGAQLLPAKPSQAVDTVLSYGKLNGKSGDSITPVLADNNTELTVTISRNVRLFFGRIFGFQSSDVQAAATARVATFSGGNMGIIPFGIVDQDFLFSRSYKLKLGGGGGYDGNFQALALGGTGASVYLDNIKYGYKGTFHVGDWIRTETGNMSGPTSSGVAYRVNLDPSATINTVQNNSGRVVIAPIIKSFDVNGTGQVQVTGFAAFFLEGVPNPGNNSYVYGSFIKMVLPGDISDSAKNYGVYGVTLTK